MNASAPALADAPTRRADATVIGLIGLAHGTSHFFHLLLPPLFPFFIREFGLDYSELGLLVTLFFVISGVGQALSGFLVDRVGARPVLFAALACFAAAALAAASAHGWAGLALAEALAGLGNAPFHPADFTILNKRVSPQRLGHAFSIHGVTGNLGWAAAPIFLLGIGSLSGSWRVAYLCAALVPLGVLALLVAHRGAVDDRRGQWAHERPGAARPAAAEHPLAFLRLPSVWLCFSFFFFSTAALAAIQSFAGPALARLYQLPTGLTAYVVTGFMLLSALGMVAGGFLVARVERLEKTIAAALTASAALLLLVASGALSALAAGVVVALAGAGIGLAGPSRDMLIKRAAPPGATGRVYGTVYSGLDTGFATAAPIFGSLMDHGLNHAVFSGAALALLMGVAAAGVVGLRLRWRAWAAA
ncbi:MAG: MFS transporter [Burkholderiales bacterium]|nr:MFS transporter [Burkholderiales bacterium]